MLKRGYFLECLFYNPSACSAVTVWTRPSTGTEVNAEFDQNQLRHVNFSRIVGAANFKAQEITLLKPVLTVGERVSI